MKNNVALIGFMAVGKTSVGKLLAEELGKQYIEVDSLIVEKAGKSIPQIFREDGEIAFRQMEIEIIQKLACQEKLVIDCGGGVVLNKINIDRLRQNAIVVWLVASPQTILKRTAVDGDARPVLKQTNGIEGIKFLLRLRKPYYQHAADIKIDTSKLSLESTVARIIELLKENEDFH
jgi:shikimate kinase